jgi:hypothetical protein
MRSALLALLVLGVAIAAAPVAPARPTGTLSISHAVLSGSVNQVDCPPGTDPTTACFQVNGSGVIPGLGAVSEQYLNVVEDPDSSCEHWHSNPVLAVRGKGELHLSVRPPQDCVVPTTGVLNASLVFTVTGGSGIYAGASGQGTFQTRGGPGTTGRNNDTLGGTVTVPGLVFDRTAPVFSGARSKTVFAARTARSIRVKYAVKARDPGHGSVPATCKPRSGSSFRLGRTSVRCSAADSSGNRATARFTITVNRRA